MQKEGSPTTAPPLRLDGLESTASCAGRTEKLNPREFLMLEQLMRFAEQSLPRSSLREAIASDDDTSIPDRKLDSWIRLLIRKTNVLNPTFPVVRQVDANNFIYSLVPPAKKKQSPN